MPRQKQEKTVELSWRDEAYGGKSAASAFRHFVDPHPSDSAEAKLQRRFRAAGYKLDWTRMSWICPEKSGSQDAPARLVGLLEADGYRVVHHGAVPQALGKSGGDPSSRIEADIGPGALKP